MYLKNKLLTVLTICLLAVLLNTCGKPQSDFVNPSVVRIYLNNASITNIVPFDIEKTNDGGYLIFGLCGESVSSRFDSNGDVYILKIDADGNTLWENCFSTQLRSGFPSNVLEIGANKYVMFWNEARGGSTVAFTFDLNTKNFTVNRTDKTCAFNCNYISFFCRTIDNQGYAVLGFGDEIVDNAIVRKMFVSLLDNNFKIVQRLTEREYSRSSFGAFGSDFDMLQSIFFYLYIAPSENRYLYTAPIGNRMGMAYVGETSSIYSDSLVWVGSLEPMQGRKVSMLLSSLNKAGDAAYLIPEYSLDNRNNDAYSVINQGKPILNLDEKANTFMVRTDDDVIVGVGTSNSGQIKIYAYQEGMDKPKEINLGNTYRYEASGLILSEDKSEIVVVGLTRINNLLLRPFVVKVKLSEILK